MKNNDDTVDFYLCTSNGSKSETQHTQKKVQTDKNKKLSIELLYDIINECLGQLKNQHKYDKEEDMLMVPSGPSMALDPRSNPLMYQKLETGRIRFSKTPCVKGYFCYCSCE